MTEIAKSEFREKNQLELNSPDHINEYLRVASPKVYVLLAALFILAISVLVWAFYGHITDKENVRGVVFPSDDITTVSIPYHGTVTQTYAITGTKVEAGQALAMVTVDNATSVLSSPCKGTVLEHINKGESFIENQSICSIVSGDSGTKNTIVAYAPFDVVRYIRVGMKAQATPTYDDREKIGYVSGVVTEVAELPISRKEALEQLKLEDLLENIFPTGESVFEIKITLDSDSTKHDGLAWSFDQDVPVSMSVGTFCDIQIISKDRSVVDYLFENVLKEARYVKMLFE